MMRIRLWVALAAVALLLSCGGRRKPPAVPPSSDWTTGVPPVTPQGAVPPERDNQRRETTLNEALAELDALETPTGVDEALFSRLKSALRDALIDRADAKQTVSVEFGASQKVTDARIELDEEYHPSLVWGYRNPGDYDLSGTVDVADLTVLAVHFYESADAESGWIDGNGDGVIDIKDITPIAANFGVSVSGYLVLYTLPSEEMEVMAQLEFEPGKTEFALPLEDTEPGEFAIVPVDARQVSGLLSAPLTFAPPRVSSVSPPGGDPGQQIRLYAEVTGQEPIDYFWEFGPSVMPTTSAEPVPLITLRDAGYYPATLTLTNPHGRLVHSFNIAIGVAPRILSVEPTAIPIAKSTVMRAEVHGSPPLDYIWEFSEGTSPQTSNLPEPSLFCTTPGTYGGSLTVINSYGSAKLNFAYSVGAAPEIIEVSADPVQPNTEATITPTVEGDGNISLRWYFGDAAEPDEVKHAPLGPVTVTSGDLGEYACLVTARSEFGEDSYAFTLRVLEPPRIVKVEREEHLDYGDFGSITDVFTPTVEGSGPFTYSWEYDSGDRVQIGNSAEPWFDAWEGAFTVSLEVSNEVGSDTWSNAYFTLGSRYCVYVRPTIAAPGEEITLEAEIIGKQPTGLEWHFGGDITPEESEEWTPTIRVGSAGRHGARVRLVYSTTEQDPGFQHYFNVWGGRYPTGPAQLESNFDVRPSTKQKVSAIGLWSRAVVANDGTFLIGTSHAITALDEGGEVKWRIPLAYHGGWLYGWQGTGNYLLYDEDAPVPTFTVLAPDGAEVSRKELAGFSDPAPRWVLTGEDWSVYLTHRDQLVKLDSDLNQVWTISLSGNYESGVVSSNGTTYIEESGSLHTVAAVSPSGTVLWRIPSGGEVAVARPEGGVYVTGTSSLRSLDEDGNLLWTYDKSGIVKLTSDGVYSIGSAGIPYTTRVTRLLSDGTVLWEREYNDGYSGATREGAIVSLDDSLLLALIHTLVSIAPDGDVKWTYYYDLDFPRIVVPGLNDTYLLGKDYWPYEARRTDIAIVK